MAIEFSLGSETRVIEIVARRPRLVLKIDGRRYEIGHEEQDGIRHRVCINGETIEFVAVRAGDDCFVRSAGRTHRVALRNPLDLAQSARAGDDEVRAPMPGVVVAVHKQPGETVRRGEPIVTIESMKLQTTIVAPRDGTIHRLTRQPNEAFGKDEVLALIGPSPSQEERCAG